MKNIYSQFSPEELKIFKKSLIRIHNNLRKQYLQFCKDTTLIKNRNFPEFKRLLADQIKEQRDAIKEVIQMMNQKLIK